jgi:hypothetical protein
MIAAEPIVAKAFIVIYPYLNSMHKMNGTGPQATEFTGIVCLAGATFPSFVRENRVHAYPAIFIFRDVYQVERIFCFFLWNLDFIKWFGIAHLFSSNLN